MCAATQRLKLRHTFDAWVYASGVFIISNATRGITLSLSCRGAVKSAPPVERHAEVLRRREVAAYIAVRRSIVGLSRIFRVWRERAAGVRETKEEIEGWAADGVRDLIRAWHR
jgi:hypothetical protein